MTDQTISADEVREIAADMRAVMSGTEGTRLIGELLSDMYGYIRDLEALLPAPPTLADMSPEERRDCQWMQADTAGADDTCVLFVIGTGSAKGVAKSGRVTTGPHECFTPRPDLPRLEWPDNDQ